jgi:hypothetical protein
MQRSQTASRPQGKVEVSDVAEADQGFWVAPQGVDVQVVDDAVGTFAAPGGNHRADSRVSERGVQVEDAILISAGHIPPLVEDVLAQLDPQPP